MKVLDNSIVKIDFKLKEDCLYLTWKSFISGSCLRDVYINTPRILGRNPTSWLVDKKKIKVISPEDQHWLYHFWNNYNTSSTIRIAFINSDDFFGRLSLKNITHMLKGDKDRIQIKLFESREKAMTWLHIKHLN